MFSTLGSILTGNIPRPEQFSTARGELDAHTAPHQSLYGRSVHGVNQAMQNANVPLSPEMLTLMQANTTLVEEGKLSQPSAHFREMKGFGREALQSLGRGDPQSAKWPLMGTVMNGLGFLGSGIIEHNNRTLGRS